MAAIVKPIEAKSIHQIQSGQVIVDLCSVVKELVENSLDAEANTIEVRFKNNGLDEVEVQDNGHGIAAINYESVALKHYTSKLSTYDDLSSLQTFGFRGEALSSLCALSTFQVITAQADEAPKGHKLEFEVSGKLRDTSVIACQKGTTTSVQNLFDKLPVRRKELSKNIKREYGKVLGLLHAYACISTNVKFTVKNTMPKAKSVTVFATKSNATTRENIANVYGAKTLTALAVLDLELDFESSASHVRHDESNLKKVIVSGHISKPIFGEGRQTPDRQMFFVNGRPCGLPQMAKAINEVYKSFNVSQSPFIFADFQMDTSAYDVNVSPDKRTVMLHDATVLVEKLKTALTELFDRQDQTMPQSHVQSSKLPSFRPLTVQREYSTTSSSRSPSADGPGPDGPVLNSDRPHNANRPSSPVEPSKLLHDHLNNVASTREEPADDRTRKHFVLGKERERRAGHAAKLVTQREELAREADEYEDVREQVMQDGLDARGPDDASVAEGIKVRDFNARLEEQQSRRGARDELEVSETTDNQPTSLSSSPAARQIQRVGVVPNAFDRMRPKRMQPDVATITIGDKTVTRFIGSQPSSLQPDIFETKRTSQGTRTSNTSSHKFGTQLQRFNADREVDLRELERISCSGSDDETVSNEHQQSEEDTNEPETIVESTNQRGVRSQLKHLMHPESFSDKYSEEDDEQQGRAIEEQRVAELIQLAENAVSEGKIRGEKRASHALKGTRSRDSVTSLSFEVELDTEELAQVSAIYQKMLRADRRDGDRNGVPAEDEADTIEEQLSLTVSKSDFVNMHIVGQFNLGFIIAVRPKSTEQAKHRQGTDELFIIDQHASDEKYNFERLQLDTIVGNQRMVRPAVLDLTAVEEEIVIDNTRALEKNGFLVDVDTSGEREVGRRCRLTSLPLSKEVIFGTKDLDELIHLLAESPMLHESSFVPRPSKVRKMFAMRACRSSIMIGKTLSRKQMSTVLQHMGSIDKPWNCPHGRPTMRHLASLDKLDPGLWKEGDGVCPGQSSRLPGSKSAANAWDMFVTA